MKRYEQACAIARALDVVGERWSLLLVRELTFGPRRYRDLTTGLPGIPSNVLAARLKDLQAAGVITRRTLPAPTDLTVYELTAAGRPLQPARTELPRPAPGGRARAPDPAGPPPSGARGGNQPAPPRRGLPPDRAPPLRPPRPGAARRSRSQAGTFPCLETTTHLGGPVMSDIRSKT